jgi:hypothetical protein
VPRNVSVPVFLRSPFLVLTFAGSRASSGHPPKTGSAHVAIQWATDIELPIIGFELHPEAGSSPVRLVVPGDTSIVPPGLYLLFIVDDAGVFVHRAIRAGSHSASLRELSEAGTLGGPPLAVRNHGPARTGRSCSPRTDADGAEAPTLRRLLSRIAAIERGLVRVVTFVEAQRGTLFGRHGTQRGGPSS